MLVTTFVEAKQLLRRLLGLKLDIQTQIWILFNYHWTIPIWVNEITSKTMLLSQMAMVKYIPYYGYPSRSLCASNGTISKAFSIQMITIAKPPFLKECLDSPEYENRHEMRLRCHYWKLS